MVITLPFKELTRTMWMLPRLFCTKMSWTAQRLPTVTLYTNKTCSLCDEAKEHLLPYKHRFLLEEVNITDPMNKDWSEKYCDDIPVFHFEGKYLMKHRVNLKDFESALVTFETNNQNKVGLNG